MQNHSYCVSFKVVEGAVFSTVLYKFLAVQCDKVLNSSIQLQIAKSEVIFICRIHSTIILK